MLDDQLLQILERVHQEKHLDFAGYKESTLKRRIERRLRATRTQSYKQYTELLDADPTEYTQLIDNLTIQVTQFFRNPEAWEVLRETILPSTIRRKIENKEQALRVWCAGCATGEEVYSVAILIHQLLDERRTDLEVDIWGTDIDEKSLLKAEQAEYKPDTVKAVSQNILNRYFDFHGNFTVTPTVRNWAHFRRHDLVLDEFLEQMDLIVCRNVAIYFTRLLQEKVFMGFCNSLHDKGYLFLGKAETPIGSARQAFDVINKRWKIYQNSSPGNGELCETPCDAAW